MSVDPNTLAQYDGKDVVLHLIQEDGSVAEFEGKVQGASEFGMAFKEKGKRDSVLVEPKEIEEIAVAATKPKNLSQKKLKPIAAGSIRQHLLDRHGFSRSLVNKMDDDAAVKAHDGIDHADLGHRHLTAEEVAKAAEEKPAESADADAA